MKKDICVRDDFKNMKDKAKFGLKGQVKVCNELDEVLFEKDNLVIVPGRKFILEKIFNVTESNYVFNDLRTIMNLSPAEDNNLAINNEQKAVLAKSVCLFGVGIGGAGEVFGDIKAVNYGDVSLRQPIPFRMVDADADLSPELREQYFLRTPVIENGKDKVAYYLKKFEQEPILTINKLDTPALIGGENYDVYVELKLCVNQNDVREYFEATQNGANARINELCLVFGYQPEGSPTNDYLGLETFSMLSFNNEAFDTINKELNITYRIYA